MISTLGLRSSLHLLLLLLDDRQEAVKETGDFSSNYRFYLTLSILSKTSLTSLHNNCCSPCERPSSVSPFFSLHLFPSSSSSLSPPSPSSPASSPCGGCCSASRSGPCRRCPGGGSCTSSFRQVFLRGEHHWRRARALVVSVVAATTAVGRSRGVRNRRRRSGRVRTQKR